MLQAQEFMRRVGEVLRTQNDGFTNAPLPERWVDLIHYLNEKERRRSETPKPEAEPSGRRRPKSN
jgi:hypothetical protein